MQIPITDNTAPGRASSPGIVKAAWTMSVVTMVWGALALGGFPFPHVDDTFFIGAGLSLASGGPLHNPLMEHSGPFFDYPPLYSYLIALWLKLFGTSAAGVV
jgi:hypothetical protein